MYSTAYSIQNQNLIQLFLLDLYSIYVEQYLGDFTPFGPAVTQALKSTDGVMIFDIVHLNKHKLWDELEQAMTPSVNI